MLVELDSPIVDDVVSLSEMYEFFVDVGEIVVRSVKRVRRGRRDYRWVSNLTRNLNGKFKYSRGWRCRSFNQSEGRHAAL